MPALWFPTDAPHRRLRSSLDVARWATGQNTGECLQFDRLCQVGVEARVERALLILRLSPTRHGDDYRRFARRSAPHLTTGFVAINAGQADIKEHDIGHGVVKGFQCACRVMNNAC
jgi:hypothetical protein